MRWAGVWGGGGGTLRRIQLYGQGYVTRLRSVNPQTMMEEMYATSYAVNEETKQF